LVESPTQRFDKIVLDAVEHVETRWRDQLASVDFAVEEVPSDEETAAIADEIESAGVPLARLFPAGADHPARIVLYRRPLELRAVDREDLEDLVHDIVVDEVAHFLGLDPDVVDPDGFHEEDGDTD
jgi:predicted Zn-dependent protease with MMP-like domain